ncbi:hypothetical protein FOA52_012149 [Chlamydomonas sp. UWO 241]|nr:hypothetical protein FOA52_012149 [Chlamydomonas sp. UWO 241]
MREDLDKREKVSTSERSEEESARSRLAVELERLRRKAAEEEKRARQATAGVVAAATAAAAAAAAAARSAAAGPSSSSAPNAGAAAAAAAASVGAQVRRSLKVSWDPTSRNYSSQQIRSALEVHGPVEDVVIKDRKKKRKAVAFVVMASEAGATAAAAAVCGDLSEPLLVTPLAKHVTGLADDGDDGDGNRNCRGPAGRGLGAGGGRGGAEQTSWQPHRPGGMPPGVGAGAAAAGGAPLFPSAHLRPHVEAGLGLGVHHHQHPGGGGSAAPVPTAHAPPLFPSSFPGMPSAAKAQPGTGGAAGPAAAPPARGGVSSFPSSSGANSGFSSFPGMPGAAPSCVQGAQAPPPPAVSSFESAVLEKMRREAGRKRALEEAEAEGAAG